MGRVCAFALALFVSFLLASALLVGPARAMIVMHDPPTMPGWVSEALKSGALDQETVDLMHRSLACRPEDCPAAWSRATDWLGQECTSVETRPDFHNDVFKFKNATGLLKAQPDIKVSVWMVISSYTSAIEIEQFDHYSESDPDLSFEQRIARARAFARFKKYMLADPKVAQ